nr:unnamed protein product [Callosobruchus analis]
MAYGHVGRYQRYPYIVNIGSQSRGHKRQKQKLGHQSCINNTAGPNIYLNPMPKQQKLTNHIPDDTCCTKTRLRIQMDINLVGLPQMKLQELPHKTSECKESASKYVQYILRGVSKYIFKMTRSTSMRRFVKKYVESCLKCQYYKHRSGKKEGLLHAIPKMDLPFHTLQMDHVGPFVKSCRGNAYILVLVIVDAFTKLAIKEAVKDTRARYVIKTSCTYSSPNETLDGFKLRHVAESYILNKVQGNLCRVDIRGLRRTISERISQYQKRQKERFDNTLAEATKYEEGQLVRINYAPPVTAASKKHLSALKVPFRAIKVLPNDRYELENLRDGRKKIRSVTAVDSMKPYIVLRQVHD